MAIRTMSILAPEPTSVSPSRILVVKGRLANRQGGLFFIFSPMKIVFMGTPEFAAHFLEHLHSGPHQVLAVVTQPDRPVGRGRVLTPPPVKSKALELGLPVLQPDSVKDASFAEELQKWNADLFVVVAFSILPKAVLAASRLGAVNVHGSLLPKYRGAAPVQWAIANGETSTGVSVFLLDEKMDHGPLLEQRIVPIALQDTASSVLEKMVGPGSEALDMALDRIENGESRELPAQEHEKASPAPKLRKEDGKIDFSRPALEIHNRIRAFCPWPGGFCSFNGKVAYFRKTNPVERNLGISPGEGKIQEGRLFVGTGKGELEVLEIQLEGKRSMSAADFLCGIQKKDSLCFKMIV